MIIGSPPDVETTPPTDATTKPLELALVEPRGPSPTDRVWGAYLEGWRREVAGTNPPKLDDKRRRLIAARLKESPVADVENAARGVWLEPWHVEKQHTAPELVFRDLGHVERFRDVFDRGPRAAAPRGPQGFVQPVRGTERIYPERNARKAGAS